MLTEEELKKRQYGIPEQRKFPLDSKAHVISAIKFFNYAEPKYRKALAARLIAKIKEYGIKVTPSKDNHFYNYYKPTSSYIAHYGRSRLNGAPIGSGRYPLGSGSEPYQFKSQPKYLNKDGSPNAKAIKKGQKLGKKLIKIDNTDKSLVEKNKLAKKAIGKSSVMKEFNKNSKAYSDIPKAKKEITKRRKTINKSYNGYIKQKYKNYDKANPVEFLANAVSDIKSYVDVGKTDEILNTGKSRLESSKAQYKKEVEPFLRQYLGDSVPSYSYNRYTRLTTEYANRKRRK